MSRMPPRAPTRPGRLPPEVVLELESHVRASLGDLGRLLARGDLPRAARLAHTLAGGAAYGGLREVLCAALELTRAAETGSLPGARRAFARLCRALPEDPPPEQGAHARPGATVEGEP